MKENFDELKDGEIDFGGEEAPEEGPPFAENLLGAELPPSPDGSWDKEEDYLE